MNIHPEKGHRIRFSHPGAGYPMDHELARKWLTVDKVYTVDHTIVHSWLTEVFLEEVPFTSFNSVLFEDVLSVPTS